MFKALAFLGVVTFLLSFIREDVYLDPEKTYRHDPKNYSIFTDWENGRWVNGTWITDDYHLYTKGKRYSFAKGEVVSFDYNTGRFHLYDGNYGEMRDYAKFRGNGETTSFIKYLKKWNFKFEVIGNEYSDQPNVVPIKKTWWNDYYDH